MFQASATLKPGRSVGEHGVFQPRGGPSFFHGLLGAAPAPPTLTPERHPKLASFRKNPHPIRPAGGLRDSPEIGFVWSTSQSIVPSALTFSDWLRLGNRHLPAQLASFRTARGTDLPVCPRPARRPLPLGAASPECPNSRGRPPGLSPNPPPELASFRPWPSSHTASAIFRSETH